MASLEELRETRLSKLRILQDKGINPYPAETNRTHKLFELNVSFDKLFSKKEDIRAVGRIMSIRGQGKILFIDLEDGSAKFQAVLKADSNPTYTNNDSIKNGMDFFIDTVDIGDFIEVGGNLFLTKSDQQSIDVKDWRILSKAILPIPDEHYGLKDDDERYRKRYLDILMDENKRELFKKKEKFWQVTRDFFRARNFKEVETPVLEITTGGAEAKPFITHHNDFDLGVYLRISVGELWQKRLMAAGFDKTFEIGKIFRNEGSSSEHLQEFTNLEFYWAYADYKDGMKLTKELFREIAKEVFGKSKFTTRGYTFDLSKDWDEIDYTEEIKKITGIDVLNATENEMVAKLQELGVKYKGKNRERLTDSLWKHCRKSISGPAFVINHPKIVSPLAKELEKNKEKTQRFQILIAGSEVGNGYSELNNPVDQLERFNKQQELINRGDEEAMMEDKEFVEMLEHGMPPTCGFGFGERLFAFLADISVREGQLFPLMKPKI